MKIIKFIAFSCLVSSFSFSSSFGKTTLDDLKSYSSSYQEYPKMDNKDLLNPDYTTFYKRMIPGVLDNFLYFLHLKRKPFWSIEKFNALVDALIAKQKEGNFIYKFTPKPETKFIIWGDLQGAFHSLVFDLEKLKEQGIIDENLKIIKDDHYFVFNGNLINRSPFSIETLFVAMSLIQQNPDKVFYLRGQQEDKETLLSYGLRREIEVRMQNLYKNEKELLIEKLDKFFNTLPLALFLKVQQEEEFVCISPSNLETGDLKEEYFASFLKSESIGIQKFDFSRATKTKEFVNIDAIIKGVDRPVEHVSTQGLVMLPPDRGATAWNILSSPTSTYQKMFNFFYDAFAVVSVGSNIYECTISSFNQDVRKRDGFREKSYYLVSGQSTSLPPSKGKIVVGCTLDTTPVNPGQGIGVVRSLSMRINEENRRGGVDGKYIKLVVLGDLYEPILARKNIEKFLTRYKTNITLSSVGSPPLEGYLDLVKSGKVLVLFYMSGAPIFRQPDLSGIVLFRASYLKEGEILTEYAINELNSKKIAFFYQNDVFGLGALSGAKNILKKYNFKNFIEIPYLKSTTVFNEEIKKLSDFDPDSVIFFSTSTKTIAFIRQYEVKNILGKKLLGLSDLAEYSVKDFFKLKGLNCIVTQIMPNPKTSNLEIVKEYRKDAKERGYNIDPVALEAYIGASLFIDIIKKIDGDITKEKIIKVVEGMKNYKFKGLDLTFDPQTRSLNNQIWLDIGTDEWIEWPIS